MKTAREVAGELCCAVDALPPTEDMGHAILDVIAAAIEARDLEWVETCATEADPACECDSFTEFSPHAECKGARDAMRRISALIPKEDSRG
jgi:hypothetical protein